MISNVLITLADGTQLRPDAAVSVTPDIQTEVTQHPVETGSSVADHTISKPTGYRLELAFTPTRGAGSGVAPSGDDRPALVWQLLRTAALTRQRLSLAVDADRLATAVIESISVPRTIDTGDSLLVSMVVREIVTVDAAVSVAPVRTASRGTKQRNKITARGVIRALPAPIYAQALASAAAGNYVTALGLASAGVAAKNSGVPLEILNKATAVDWPPEAAQRALAALGL